MHTEVYHKNETQQWIFERRLAFKRPTEVEPRKKGERFDSVVEGMTSVLAGGVKFALRPISLLWDTPLAVGDIIGTTFKGAFPRTVSSVRKSIGDVYCKAKDVLNVGFSRKLFPALGGLAAAGLLFFPKLVDAPISFVQDAPTAVLGAVAGFGESTARTLATAAQLPGEMGWDAFVMKNSAESVVRNLTGQEPYIFNGFSGNKTTYGTWMNALKSAA